MSPLWSLPVCSPGRRGLPRGAPPPAHRLKEPWAGGRGRPAPRAPEESGTSPWRRTGTRWAGRRPWRSSFPAPPAETPPRNTPPHPRTAAWWAERMCASRSDPRRRESRGLERCHGWSSAVSTHVLHGGGSDHSREELQQFHLMCRRWMRRGGVKSGYGSSITPVEKERKKIQLWLKKKKCQC